jgi:arylsulfatase A-like enzyme
MSTKESLASSRFEPMIWLYMGLTAVLFSMHSYRVVINSDWNYEIALGAAIADLGILIVFLLLYVFGNRAARNSPVVHRLNSGFHYALIALIAIIAWVSQLLLMKTGETLDIDIILFAIAHASDLSRVLGSEADSRALYLFIGCALPLLVVSVKTSNRKIALLRNAVILAPLVMLPACSYFDRDIDSLTYIGVDSEKRDKALYRGEYVDSVNKQLDWVTVPLSHWQRGILSGLVAGTPLGKAEYLALAQKAGSENIYVKPSYKKQDGPSPNVVLIILESFRHSSVDAYLSEEEIKFATNTPFINSLAEQGVLVERAYTTVPHTSKALIGIYCGTFPHFSSRISEAESGALPLSCLPHLLSDGGYMTAHFQTASGTFEGRENLLKNIGFHHSVVRESLDAEKWGHVGYLGLDDRALIKPSLEWMKQQKSEGKPYFASILTLSTHHPYAFPGNEKGVSNPAEALGSYTQGVRYTDAVIAELFAELEKEGLVENTVFILTGDHGEAFAEHGQIMHNGVSYEEGQRVPLILYGPEIVGVGERVTGLRQHIDLMPTILSLAHIEYSGVLPGMDIFAGKGHESIITSCFYTDYCLNYYTDDGLKLSYYYGKRAPELYLLPTDPEEANNLLHGDEVMHIEPLVMNAAKFRSSYERVYLFEN